MKIMFCMDSMNKGGCERVVANLANYFIKNNYDVTIVNTASIHSEYELSNMIQLYKLDVKDNYKENIISKNVRRLKELKKIYLKEQPNVIISFLPNPSFRILLLRKYINVPIIVSDRNDPKVEYSNFLYNLLEKKLYKKADGFVFQTEDAKHYFSKDIQNKSIVIPNPINEKFILSKKVIKRKKEIVGVGRLEKQKNFNLLINAFANSNISNEYKLEIYGEGSLRNELQQLINDLNISNRVTLKGNVDNIQKYIYNTSLFVMSSNYEGMPNALMEAMALGLPVISTNCPCGGPKFLIENHVNGALVPVDDKEALTKEIEFMISNSKIANNYGDNARDIFDKLDPQKIMKQWENYINKIAK